MTYSEQIQVAYACLGLEFGATEAEVNSAYKEITKRFHPDLHMNDTEDEIAHFNILQAQANDARDTLQKYFDLQQAKAEVSPQEELRETIALYRKMSSGINRQIKNYNLTNHNQKSTQKLIEQIVDFDNKAKAALPEHIYNTSQYTHIINIANLYHLANDDPNIEIDWHSARETYKLFNFANTDYGFKVLKLALQFGNLDDILSGPGFRSLAPKQIFEEFKKLDYSALTDDQLYDIARYIEHRFFNLATNKALYDFKDEDLTTVRDNCLINMKDSRNLIRFLTQMYSFTKVENTVALIKKFDFKTKDLVINNTYLIDTLLEHNKNRKNFQLLTDVLLLKVKNPYDFQRICKIYKLNPKTFLDIIKNCDTRFYYSTITDIVRYCKHLGNRPLNERDTLHKIKIELAKKSNNFGVFKSIIENDPELTIDELVEILDGSDFKIDADDVKSFASSYLDDYKPDEKHLILYSLFKRYKTPASEALANTESFDEFMNLNLVVDGKRYFITKEDKYAGIVQNENLNFVDIIRFSHENKNKNYKGILKYYYLENAKTLGELNLAITTQIYKNDSQIFKQAQKELEHIEIPSVEAAASMCDDLMRKTKIRRHADINDLLKAMCARAELCKPAPETSGFKTPTPEIPAPDALAPEVPAPDAPAPEVPAPATQPLQTPQQPQPAQPPKPSSQPQRI
ncbi:MAG: J domain-containing protein [Clostridiales bacterium]|jgi:hypothetical protein|nr:J domain-containing protein [Clostridiales bacterium]